MKNQSETQFETRHTESLERMLSSFGPLGADDIAYIRDCFTGAQQTHAAGTPVIDR